jgi:uncharacterized protein (TIGR03086 family)
MSDPRVLIGRALDQAEKVIAVAGEESMDRATPCSEFDVRTLSGHMIGVVRRVVHTGQGGKATDISSVIRGLPADDLVPLFRTARAELDQTWADDGLLEKTLSLPFGEFTGRVALLAYSQELTMHSWDLATALDRLDLLDESLGEAVLSIAREFVPPEPRGGHVPFGPVIEVPADAGAYMQLAGYLGRQP